MAWALRRAHSIRTHVLPFVSLSTTSSGIEMTNWDFKLSRKWNLSITINFSNKGMHVMFCDWWIYLKIIALADTMWEEMRGIMLLATGLYQIYSISDLSISGWGWDAIFEYFMLIEAEKDFLILHQHCVFLWANCAARLGWFCWSSGINLMITQRFTAHKRQKITIVFNVL